MKTVGKCPECGKVIEENCDECIRQGESFHNCKGKMKTVKVKWSKTPESEKDLMELEI